MNKDNAHDFIPLLQALGDGLTIQEDYFGEWSDLSDEISFSMKPEFYRIKPEPRTFKMWLYSSTGRMYPLVDEIATGETGDWEHITVREVLK